MKKVRYFIFQVLWFAGIYFGFFAENRFVMNAMLFLIPTWTFIIFLLVLSVFSDKDEAAKLGLRVSHVHPMVDGCLDFISIIALAGLGHFVLAATWCLQTLLLQGIYAHVKKASKG